MPPINDTAIDTETNYTEHLQNAAVVFGLRRDAHRELAAQKREERERNLAMFVNASGPEGKQLRERVYRQHEWEAMRHDHEAERWEARRVAAEKDRVLLYDSAIDFQAEFLPLIRQGLKSGRVRTVAPNEFSWVMAAIPIPRTLG
jgi:hypothetical protein